MRRRLVAALVGVALATLLLYAGPRAFMISDMVREREELGLDRTADLVAEAVDLGLTDDPPIDDAGLATLLTGRDDLEIVARLSDGTELRTGRVEGDVRRVERPLSGGGTVVVALATEAIDRRVGDALVPIFAFGVGATAFAIVVALLLARHLSTPFTRLAEHAEHLGAEAGTDAPRSGVPEADDLADALDRSRARIAELLRAEREFSSNASHQLRTPLSALRLRVEDVSTWPGVAPEVRAELEAALGEVDRLADTVTDLLELARSGGIGDSEEVDLHAVAADAAARWQERYDEAGRRLVLRPHPGEARAATSERGVQHVLDVLFENALVHGAGTTEVDVQDRGDRVALRVADEGSFDRTLSERAFLRRARSAASGGSGIGLDLARGIAESAGCRLVLVSQDPTAFELIAPRRAGPAGDG